MLGTVEATDRGRPSTAQTGSVSAPRTNLNQEGIKDVFFYGCPLLKIQGDLNSHKSKVVKKLYLKATQQVEVISSRLLQIVRGSVHDHRSEILIQVTQNCEANRLDCA